MSAVLRGHIDTSSAADGDAADRANSLKKMLSLLQKRPLFAGAASKIILAHRPVVESGETDISFVGENGSAVPALRKAATDEGILRSTESRAQGEQT